jgi:hypothetical protein
MAVLPGRTSMAVVAGPTGRRQCQRGCRGVGRQCSLRRSGPGTGVAAVAKGSWHGGGGDNDGVPTEAVMMGSRWWQHALKLLPWHLAVV